MDTGSSARDMESKFGPGLFRSARTGDSWPIYQRLGQKERNAEAELLCGHLDCDGLYFLLRVLF